MKRIDCRDPESVIVLDCDLRSLSEEFVRHLAADAKILDEDEETGAKKYRYIRTGPDHYSLAFCYAWLAAQSNYGGRVLLRWMRDRAKAVQEGRG